jgi:hypothetical protein
MCSRSVSCVVCQVPSYDKGCAFCFMNLYENAGVLGSSVCVCVCQHQQQPQFVCVSINNSRSLCVSASTTVADSHLTIHLSVTAGLTCLKCFQLCEGGIYLLNRQGLGQRGTSKPKWPLHASPATILAVHVPTLHAAACGTQRFSCIHPYNVCTCKHMHTCITCI